MAKPHPASARRRLEVATPRDVRSQPLACVPHDTEQNVSSLGYIASMRSTGEVRLPFVQDERGVLKWVPDLVDLPPKQLTKLRCHCCQDPVEIHAAKGASPYATHAAEPSRVGWVPDTDTLLHEAAKLHLREALRQVGVLFSVRTCGVCRARQEFVLAKGWDAVEVEKPLGTRHPDVVALTDGKPVLAVEVLLPREVREATYAALDRRDLPWVAVEARDFASGTWQGTQPLRVLRFAGPPWVCVRCVARRAAEENRRGRMRVLLSREEEYEVFDEGAIVYKPRVSSYTASSRARYAPAGTLSLIADEGVKPLGSEDFAHACVSRVMELEIGGRRVRLDFNIALHDADPRPLLALTCRMMEGDTLGDPRVLSTTALGSARETSRWLALMKSVQRAVVPEGNAPLRVAYDEGWTLERAGCACGPCQAGRAAITKAPKRLEDFAPPTLPKGLAAETPPQLVLFAEEDGA